MISTSKDMVLSFVDSLVPTVRRALCDEAPEVRQAAAKTFDSLHNTVSKTYFVAYIYIYIIGARCPQFTPLYPTA